MNGVTTLQIPLDKTLKANATAVAEGYGFSSLQEIVRVILTKLANRQLAVSFVEEPAIQLSKKAEKRYAKMAEDFRLNRNVKSFTSVEDLMKDLRS